MASVRAIGRVGTGIRIAVGVSIVMAALQFDYPSRGIGWWDAVTLLVVLPLIAIGAAWAVNAAYRRSPAAARRARTPWSAHQTGIAVIVIGAVVIVSTALTFPIPMNRIAIFLFFGASMVLAAIRGYEGCEILALPNLVLRHTDAVWCPLYTPIDKAERQPGAQVQVGQRKEMRMPSYADLRGVRTWYDAHGNGEPLVLLHPGGADSRALAPILDVLAAHFQVFTPERRGHGHTPDVDGPLTFELMAGDTIAFLETVVGGPAHLAGCSDGAIVALLAALRRPELALRLAFVAGVFHYDGWVPGVIDPNNVPPQFMADSYGEVSPDGIDHFSVIAAKLARAHEKEPSLSAEDLARLSNRTLIMIGDDDEVTAEHAVAMYRSLPYAELAVIPGTSHGLLVEKPALCNSILLEFLTNDPTPTLAPIRRRPPTQFS